MAIVGRTKYTLSGERGHFPSQKFFQHYKFKHVDVISDAIIFVDPCCRCCCCDFNEYLVSLIPARYNNDNNAKYKIN